MNYFKDLIIKNFYYNSKINNKYKNILSFKNNNYRFKLKKNIKNKTYKY
jgi:hypothetical protein